MIRLLPTKVSPSEYCAKGCGVKGILAGAESWLRELDVLARRRNIRWKLRQFGAPKRLSRARGRALQGSPLGRSMITDLWINSFIAQFFWVVLSALDLSLRINSS